MDRIKFKEDPNLIELAEDIYLYKNFLNQEIVDHYTNQLNSFVENDWHQHGNFEIGDIEGTYWGDRCSLDIIESDFHDPIFNFFAPNYWIYQHDNFIRLKTGENSPLNENDSFFINNSPIGSYKIALYLGKFTGGAIHFPKLNFTYQPEANDLLIFKISKGHIHETYKVLSGTRYAYMDCLIYHPGYFMV